MAHNPLHIIRDVVATNRELMHLMRPSFGMLRAAERVLAGILPAHEHPRVAAALAAPLPLSSDLTVNPPTNQGRSSACTSHALIKALEIVTGFRGSMHVLYSAAGKMAGSLADNGRTCIDNLTIVRTLGVAPFEGNSPDGRNSDIWTASDIIDLSIAAPPNVNVAASPEELAAAGRHVINLCHNTISPKDSKLSDLLVACLAAKAPVYLGTQIGAAFENLGNGVVAQPDPANDPTAGGHALIIVGHRTNPDGSRDFKIENSWGESWDDKGECWASIAWVANCWELHPILLVADTHPSLLGRIENVVETVVKTLF